MSEAEDESGRVRVRPYKQQLRVGTHLVDPGALSIQPEQGDAVRVKPKAMAVLLELARQPGITVPREELLDRVWEHSYVTPGVVAHAITALRRAFGDTLEKPSYIETIPRIGYRLLVPVEALAPAMPPGQATGATGAAAAAADPPPAAEPASAAASAPPAAPEIRADRRRRRLPLLLFVLPLLALMSLAAWWVLARQSPTPVSLVELRRVTFGPGSENTPRLNAAGDWLVYSAAAQVDAKPVLQLQSAFGTQALPLAGGDHAEHPAWSPQGRSVAYVWRDGARCEIRIHDIDTRARQTIATCPAGSIVYLDWSPADPALIAYSAVRPGQSGGTRLQLLRNQGGWRPLRLAYTHTPGQTDLYPRFSPDGRYIAFRRSTNPTSDLYRVAVTGGDVTRITQLRANLEGFDWLPDGSGLVFSSDHAGTRALYLVGLRTGAVLSLGMPDAASPDISAAGWRLAFRQDNWRSALAALDVADGAKPSLLAPSSGRDESGAISPDGQRVVLGSDRDGSSQLWSLDVRTQELQRITQHDNARIESPSISADGSRVLYVRRSSGRFELWEHRFADGVRQRITTMPASVRNAIYAADGLSLWIVGWHQDRWALHACKRQAALAACDARATAESATRVERARIDGTDALVLVPARGGSNLRVVAERDLRLVRELTLPSWLAWNAVGDSVWYLLADGGDGNTTTLQAVSLRDGSTTRLATYGRLARLPVTRFTVTPDRRRLIFPVITENSSDVMLARIRRARD